MSKFPDYDPSLLWIANPKKITQFPNKERKADPIPAPFVASKPDVDVSVSTPPVQPKPLSTIQKPSLAERKPSTLQKPSISPSRQKPELSKREPEKQTITMSSSPYDLFSFSSQLDDGDKAPVREKRNKPRPEERRPERREVTDTEETRGKPRPPAPLSHLSDEERDLIHQARWFYKKGYKIPLYDTNADMEQVYFDVTRIHEQLELTSHVKNMKKQYMTYATGIEILDSQVPFDMNMGNLTQDVAWMLEKEEHNMERDYYINGAVKSDNPAWEIKMAFGLLLLQKFLVRNPGIQTQPPLHKTPLQMPTPPGPKSAPLGGMMEGGLMGKMLPFLGSVFSGKETSSTPQLRPFATTHPEPQQTTPLQTPLPSFSAPEVDLESLTKRALAGMDSLDDLTEVSDIPDL